VDADKSRREWNNWQTISAIGVSSRFMDGSVWHRERKILQRT
jgi:hypothetical protein